MSMFSENMNELNQLEMALREELEKLELEYLQSKNKLQKRYPKYIYKYKTTLLQDMLN